MPAAVQIGWIEFYLRQRAFEICKVPLCQNFGAAETLPAPFCYGVQWRVLQQLQTAPLDPAIRGVASARMELLDQTSIPL